MGFRMTGTASINLFVKQGIDVIKYVTSVDGSSHLANYLTVFSNIGKNLVLSKSTQYYTAEMKKTFLDQKKLFQVHI